MNRVLYYICRVMNWVLPIVLLWFGNEAIYKATDGSLEKTMYQIKMFGAVDFSVSLAVFCTFLLFWIIRIWAFRCSLPRTKDRCRHKQYLCRNTYK